MDDFQYIASNTMIFNVDLDFDIKWKWHRVKRIHDNQLTISYERSIYDLTSKYQTTFIDTPRYYCYMPISQ